MTDAPLLSVRDLSVSVRLGDGSRMPILTDMAFDLEAGDAVGVVGESGSGKSLLSLAIMGLLPGVAEASGTIALAGENLLAASEERLCEIRGNSIGMIFQEPMTALNPAMTVGDQIAEGLVWHRDLSWRDARAQAVDLLDQVRIPDARRRAKTYPHEMSGGQRQRVGIAIALALKPALMSRRRADDRARRHGTGGSAGHSRRTGRRIRHGADAGEPRPRRHRPHVPAYHRHVCRAPDGGRRDPRRPDGTAQSLYARTDRRRAETHRRRWPAFDHSRHRARLRPACRPVCRRFTDRCPVRDRRLAMPANPAGRALPTDAACAASGRKRR